MWTFQLAILDPLKPLTSIRITSKALNVVQKAQPPLRLPSAFQASPQPHLPPCTGLGALAARPVYCGPQKRHTVALGGPALPVSSILLHVGGEGVGSGLFLRISSPLTSLYLNSGFPVGPTLYTG